MDLTIALHGLVLVTAGYTADAGPGFGIGLDMRGEQFSFGIELRGVLPGKVYARHQIIPSKPITPSELDVGQMSAQFVPCLRFAKYFAGCGVVQVGVVTMKDSLAEFINPMFGLGPRFAVEVPLSDRFAVFGFGEALFALYGAGRSYYVDFENQDTSAGVIWDQSDVSAFFGVGLVVKFQ